MVNVWGDIYTFSYLNIMHCIQTSTYHTEYSVNTRQTNSKRTNKICSLRYKALFMESIKQLHRSWGFPVQQDPVTTEGWRDDGQQHEPPKKLIHTWLAGTTEAKVITYVRRSAEAYTHNGWPVGTVGPHLLLSVASQESPSWQLVQRQTRETDVQTTTVAYITRAG